MIIIFVVGEGKRKMFKLIEKDGERRENIGD